MGPQTSFRNVSPLNYPFSLLRKIAPSHTKIKRMSTKGRNRRKKRGEVKRKGSGRNKEGRKKGK